MIKRILPAVIIFLAGAAYCDEYRAPRVNKIIGGAGMSVSPSRGTNDVTLIVTIPSTGTTQSTLNTHISSYTAFEIVVYSSFNAVDVNKANASALTAVKVSTPILTAVSGNIIPQANGTQTLGSADNKWDGANIVNLSTAAGGGTTTVYRTISIYIPGDAYVTTGIAYVPPIGHTITLSSAVATVTADGLSPIGGGRLNFNIMRSSSSLTIPIGIPAFESILNSTFSLSLVANSSFTSTTDFKQTVLYPNDTLRLDIGEICGTRAGGSPICVSLYGKQD